MSDSKATNVVWHPAMVTREDRERQNGHRGAILWFTGLSGSGKSTIAHAVERRLLDLGVLAFVLDGDNLRHGLNRNLGFTPEDRGENIRRAGEVAKLFLDAGLITLVSFISPYRADRDNVRSGIEPGRFAEVYMKCSLATCEQRDPKGLYRKARAGEIAQFTGISAPYEEPVTPELLLETDSYSVPECVDAVVSFLTARKLVPSRGGVRE